MSIARIRALLGAAIMPFVEACAAAVPAFCATLLLPLATWSPGRPSDSHAFERLIAELWSSHVPLLGFLLGGVATLAISLLGFCFRTLVLRAAYRVVVVWALSFATAFAGVIFALYFIYGYEPALLTPAVWLLILAFVYSIISSIPVFASTAAHPRQWFVVAAVVSILACGVFVYACRKA